MENATAAQSRNWRVICLCAAWCGVCRDWEGVFAEAARTHPAARFDWVDIEDEADAMGEVDVETFPTVLLAHDGVARFLGPVQPSAGQLARLLARLETDSATQPVSAAAQALFQRLLAGPLAG